MQTSKLLWTDTEDWITCEIRGYWKDWICYVKDVINKRSEETLPEESPSDIGDRIEKFIRIYKEIDKNKIHVETRFVLEDPQELKDNIETEIESAYCMMKTHRKNI